MGVRVPVGQGSRPVWRLSLARRLRRPARAPRSSLQAAPDRLPGVGLTAAAHTALLRAPACTQRELSSRESRPEQPPRGVPARSPRLPAGSRSLFLVAALLSPDGLRGRGDLAAPRKFALRLGAPGRCSTTSQMAYAKGFSEGRAETSTEMMGFYVNMPRKSIALRCFALGIFRWGRILRFSSSTTGSPSAPSSGTSPSQGAGGEHPHLHREPQLSRCLGAIVLVGRCGDVTRLVRGALETRRASLHCRPRAREVVVINKVLGRP